MYKIESKKLNVLKYCFTINEAIFYSKLFKVKYREVH